MSVFIIKQIQVGLLEYLDELVINYTNYPDRCMFCGGSNEYFEIHTEEKKVRISAKLNGNDNWVTEKVTRCPICQRLIGC